jgi:hypothetical protein
MRPSKTIYKISLRKRRPKSFVDNKAMKLKTQHMNINPVYEFYT